MSKIALIADTHFGISNSNNLFLQYQSDFFHTLKAALIKEGITDLIHLGDLYDVRKSINFKTLDTSFNFFTNNFLDAPFQTHIIVGNHDSYNKYSLKINAPRTLLDWSPFKIYDKPEEIEIDGCKILIIPWICKDNTDECHKALDESFADICCGHFDISGFNMSKFIINQSGLKRDLFKKFNRTFSGHFHLPSNQESIMYIGSPYQLSWNDYGDTKRVVIYDTQTDELEYLENANFIYEKINYAEGYKLRDNYANKIVKVYVNDSLNSYEFDAFMRKLNDQNPYSVTVIDQVDYDGINDSISFAKKDTMEFLVEYIDEMEFEIGEKDLLKELMLNLYDKAQEIQ